MILALIISPLSHYTTYYPPRRMVWVTQKVKAVFQHLSVHGKTSNPGCGYHNQNSAERLLSV